MKKLITLYSVTSLLMSCYCLDCKPLIIDFHYVNSTGTPVEITIDYGIAAIEAVNERIEVDEILELKYAEAELEGGIFGEHVSIEFKFMTKTSTCITFSGALNDSIVDPRFQHNWMQYPTAWEFVIADSLYAGAELCDSSTL